MGLLNFGAGAAAFTGPAVLGPLGTGGVVVIFAGLHVSAVLRRGLTLLEHALAGESREPGGRDVAE